MCSVFTTRQSNARAPSRKGANQPALRPPRPLEEGISRAGAPYSQEEIDHIIRRHGELVAEGGRKYQIIRVLAAEMGAGAGSISETIRALKAEGALGPDLRRNEKRPFSASDEEFIIRTRAEMDAQGKTDTEISRFLAAKLERGESSMWGKLQQMIRDGKLEKKRALMREMRRKLPSPALTWKELRERLCKTGHTDADSGAQKKAGTPEKPAACPAPQNKGLRTFGEGPEPPKPRPARHMSPEIAALLAKARNLHKSRLIPLDSACMPEEALRNVARFVRSGIKKEGRLSRRAVGDGFEYRFALAGSLKIEVEYGGGQILFRKNAFPALIFVATMANGTDKEISNEVRALRSELEANMPLFPNSFPSWLELKLWAAREFHLENDLSGRHASASMKIGNSIDFKALRKFFDATMDKHI